MQAFLEGVSVRFSLDMVRLDLCTEFQQAVLRAEYGIPRGQVSTYQLIGRFLGKPSAARAVGTALANNPFPIIIPCHRAIRSDGTLGGYQGGLSMKRALLEMEGVSFDGAGRVVTENLFYATPGEGATPLRGQARAPMSSSHGEREGEAHTALPGEGATRAPMSSSHGEREGEAHTALPGEGATQPL